MEVPTWADVHGQSNKERGHGEWYYNTVLQYLRKELFKGTWYYGKRGNPREEWIPVDVPSVVSEELWNAAQSQSSKNKSEKKTNVKYQYLMRGRLRCSCGYTMIARSLQQGRYLYYGCTARDKGHSLHRCDSPYFPARDVDGTFWNSIAELLKNPKAMLKGMRQEQQEREKAVEPLRERLRVTEHLIEEKQERLERLLDLYLDGAFEKSALGEKQAEIRATIAQLQGARESLEKQVAGQTISDHQIETIEEFAAKVNTGLIKAENDFQQRRKLIELLDVRGTLSVEDGKKVAYIESDITGEKALVGIVQEHKFSSAVWPPNASQA